MVGKIKDYYKPGDDKLIFMKPLSAPEDVVVKEESVPGVVRVEAPDPVMTA
jgi:hypothetical protein